VAKTAECIRLDAFTFIQDEGRGQSADYVNILYEHLSVVVVSFSLNEQFS